MFLLIQLCSTKPFHAANTETEDEIVKTTFCPLEHTSYAAARTQSPQFVTRSLPACSSVRMLVQARAYGLKHTHRASVSNSEHQLVVPLVVPLEVPFPDILHPVVDLGVQSNVGVAERG